MTTNNFGKQLAHQRRLSDHSPFGQVQGNELIEVLQEIRDELRELRAVTIALTAISDTLEEK